ncbi:MAG: hypothetical protein ABIK25_10180 [Pseudomonadota bacterium]
MIAFIQEVVSLDNGCTFFKLIALWLSVNEAIIMQNGLFLGEVQKMRIFRKNFALDAQIQFFLELNKCCLLQNNDMFALVIPTVIGLNDSFEKVGAIQKFFIWYLQLPNSADLV